MRVGAPCGAALARYWLHEWCTTGSWVGSVGVRVTSAVSAGSPDHRTTFHTLYSAFDGSSNPPPPVIWPGPYSCEYSATTVRIWPPTVAPSHRPDANTAVLVEPLG